jgi:uncharacterized protein YkwD
LNELPRWIRLTLLIGALALTQCYWSPLPTPTTVPTPMPADTHTPTLMPADTDTPTPISTHTPTFTPTAIPAGTHTPLPAPTPTVTTMPVPTLNRTPTGAPAAATPTVTATVSSVLVALEQEMVDAVNAERRAGELSPYEVDPALAAVARAHAQDMVDRDYLSHVTPEGKTYRDRLAENGLEPYWSGENFIYVVRPAEETVVYAIAWFMDDPPHRDNILSVHYERIGVGVAGGPGSGYVFVLDFAGE